jgi:hypothetical protein
MEAYVANPAPVAATPAIVRQSPVWKIAAGVLALGMAGALWMLSQLPPVVTICDNVLYRRGSSCKRFFADHRKTPSQKPRHCRLSAMLP